MYFFIFDTTIKMSDSSAAASDVGDDGAGVAAVTTMRCGVAGAAGGAAGEGVAMGEPPAGAEGERSSTAQASRWRSTATWLSQQPTLQNTRRVADRLHVETLHAKYCVE